MTLIVRYLSESHAILASDRRVTWMQQGRQNVYDDRENKAALITTPSGSYLMGYTGVARVKGGSTERWLADRIGTADPADCFGSLKSAMESDFASLIRRGYRHAFVAVGYERGEGDHLDPVTVVVSNALQPDGTWLNGRDVSVNRTAPSLSGLAFWLDASAGIRPESSDLAEAREGIRRFRERYPGRVLGIARYMVRLIRSVQDEEVGSEISVAVLPRTATGIDAIAAPARGIRDPVVVPTCMFVPSAKGLDQADIYTPAVLKPGSYQIWGVEYGSLGGPIDPQFTLVIGDGDVSAGFSG